MSFEDDARAQLATLQGLLRAWVVNLIHEERPMWRDDGVDLTRADIIDIIGSITRDGNKVTLGSLTAAVNADTVDSLHAAAFTSPKYLVTEADANLTNEVIVGATPGGELGGSWATPTVDATHSGSAHHSALTVGSDAAALFDIFVDYPTTVLALSPSCYWRCGEASGNLADSSGNSNTAAYAGTPTYGVTGAISGDSNKAVSILGDTDDYFQAANSATVDTADTFSIVAWIKKAANDAERIIISRPADGYDFRFTAANKLELVKCNVSIIVDSTTTITDTNWHMVAVTKNGAAVHLYIDPVDVTGTVTDATIVANAGVIVIGKNAQLNNDPWNGSLDEIAVFPTALTATNILALYTAGTGGTGQVLHIDAQAANTVLAGPTSGGVAKPAFRALADADVPATHSGSAHHTQSHDHSAAGDGQSLQPLNYKWPNPTELTIAAGVITVTQSCHRIDTEADAATDDITMILGLVAHQWYLFFPTSGARSAVFKHGVVNIYCVGNVDITLDDAQDFVLGYAPNGTEIYIMSGDFVGPIATHAALDTGVHGAGASTLATAADIVAAFTESGGPTALTLAAVADGEYLKRDGATIVGAAGGGGGSTSLAGLADVNIPAPADDDVLTWDAGAGEWVSAPAAGGTLDPFEIQYLAYGS